MRSLSLSHQCFIFFLFLSSVSSRLSKEIVDFPRSSRLKESHLQPVKSVGLDNNHLMELLSEKLAQMSKELEQAIMEKERLAAENRMLRGNNSATSPSTSTSTLTTPPTIEVSKSNGDVPVPWNDMAENSNSLIATASNPQPFQQRLRELAAKGAAEQRQ